MGVLEDTWTKPELAWEQAKEWQVTQSPIIAVEIDVGSELTGSVVTRDSSRKLANLWIPQVQSVADAPRSDLGSSHRIVALVCYMCIYRHYVAFCRRQEHQSRCLFFN